MFEGLGGDDEFQCAYNPVGSAKKRVGRQNIQLPELPDGGGNADIPPKKPTKTETTKPETTKPEPTTQSVVLDVTVAPISGTNTPADTVKPESTTSGPEDHLLSTKPNKELQTTAPTPVSEPSNLKPEIEFDSRNTTLNVEDFITTTSDDLIPDEIESNTLFECKE